MASTNYGPYIHRLHEELILQSMVHVNCVPTYSIVTLRFKSEVHVIIIVLVL